MGADIRGTLQADGREPSFAVNTWEARVSSGRCSSLQCLVGADCRWHLQHSQPLQDGAHRPAGCGDCS